MVLFVTNKNQNWKFANKIEIYWAYDGGKYRNKNTIYRYDDVYVGLPLVLRESN